MLDVPVFIGGFRSGTTLLINLLGMHPHITPWFETKELCEALRWQHVLQHPATAAFEAAYCPPDVAAGFTPQAVAARMHWHLVHTARRISGARASGKAGHERYPLGNDYVLYSLQEAEAALAAWQRAAGDAGHLQQVAAATGTLIRTLGARQRQLHGGGHWINKTPEITRFAEPLRAAVGRCRIIYLVRDGLQVVASGHRLQWGSIEALAHNWKGLLERTRAAMQAHPDDYLELRYERLVQEPVATLDSVLQFCGDSPRGAEIVSEFRRRFGSGAFDATRLADSGELNAAQIEAFNRHAGDLQKALGYRTT
jgi:hypothetical protein